VVKSEEAMSSSSERWSYRACWSSALMLAGMFWLAHALGFREHTSIWAGTHVGSTWTIVAGALYLSLYMLWICAVPIFMISGVLLWGGAQLERRKSREA
jgi:hypothetical protein